MSGARDAILGSVRRALRRPAQDPEAEARVERRLSERPRGPIPARGQLDPAAQVDLFESLAIEQAAQVTRVAGDQDIPAAVADYLKAENLPARLKLAPEPALETLPWDRQPLLEVTAGGADAEDSASLTLAVAGVAETGTLMLHSGPTGPSGLNFLPETHMVVLRATDVVGDYEAAWERLRARFGDTAMPRTVNLITGPSRTGDVEQTIQLGAHGPRRLHILLVEDERQAP